MKKTFVSVDVRFKEDGQMCPLRIMWTDGKVFEIDRVLNVKNRPSLKVGGIGVRFEIRIKGNQTYLFYEDGKWFVEEK